MYDLHAYYNLASFYAYQSEYDAKYILTFFRKMRDENPELMKKMSENGREWVKTNRSYQNIAKKLEDQFYRLVDFKD